VPRRKTLSDEDAVRAAARVLQREGPSRFTLARVGREAGLSAATLLQRFGSKRGLLVAFAKTAADEAAAPFERARERNQSPLAALEMALVTIAQDLSSRQQVVNGLAVLLDDLRDEVLLAAAARHAENTEDAIRALLDAAVLAGELAGTDTKRLALSVQAAWNGAIVQWALRGTGPFDTFLMRVLRPLLRAPPGSRARPQGRTTKARSRG
jgi:AcrR family transcriptional regulator